MNKAVLILLIFPLIGAGCFSKPTPVEQTEDDSNLRVEMGESIVLEPGEELSEDFDPADLGEPDVVLPIENYINGRTFKAFGEHIQDRFRGYHVGDDVEFVDAPWDVPVNAIADGTVAQVTNASGYGGVMVLRHELDGRTIHSLYGHIDLGSVELETGDAVEKGQQIAILGDHESAETDGERKHLHFSLWEGPDIRLAGYVASESEINRWINPSNFYAQLGEGFMTSGRVFDPETDLGGDVFPISFEIPEDWEVEYIPSLEALNLYTLKGEGSARDRSQVLIRYFDASNFLTLNTVTIHETDNLLVGQEDYIARRYDIEKKEGVADFADQPDWRNDRHIVTDFRGAEGFTRYFVVAANPELDEAVYEEILESMEVVQ